jgi:hypothetical protein
MKTLLLFILTLLTSYIALYGLAYYFTNEINPMLWNTSSKILFLISLLIITKSEIELL